MNPFEEKSLELSKYGSYFVDNDRDVIEFVRTYIEVDKIISSNKGELSKNCIIDYLIDIKESVKTGSISTELRGEIGSLKMTLETVKGYVERPEKRISNDENVISNKIDNITTTINTLASHFSNSAKKGQIAESTLMGLLTENFQDTNVKDTSMTANSGDIHMMKEGRPTILIDSKNFSSKAVPKRDLDKFYQDVQLNDCSGILCNAFGGIANRKNFEIDIIDNNILIFIHSHAYDVTMFRLAVNIIYNLSERMKENKRNEIKIDGIYYQNLKIEYNYYLNSFQHHLDLIKSNIHSLSQLSFKLLDQFFKRRTIKQTEKKFTCEICGMGCATDKTLKAHVKKKHTDM